MKKQIPLFFFFLILTLSLKNSFCEEINLNENKIRVIESTGIPAATTGTAVEPVNEDFYKSGTEDADRYFNGGGAFFLTTTGGIFLSPLFSGLIGLTYITVNKVTPPETVGEEKLKNRLYLTGYHDQATKTEKNYAKKGFVVSLIYYISVYLLIYGP